jgi:hypothetical protein
MYGLGFSCRYSQSYASLQPMLPYRFQKTSRSTSIFCDQWLDGVACSNVALTLCSLELQHILRFLGDGRFYSAASHFFGNHRRAIAEYLSLL